MDCIHEFEQWMTEEGKATKTIENYLVDVRQFEKFRLEKIQEGMPENPLSRFLFTRYKKWLMECKLATSTINKKINSLKVYNDFLQKKGYVDDSYISIRRDKIQIASGSEHIVDVLSEEEVDRFLFYLEGKKVSQRNKLVGYLLLYTGVRVSELTSIRMENISSIPSTITIQGKGGKIREIPLRKDVLGCIKDYVNGERSHSKAVHHRDLVERNIRFEFVIFTNRTIHLVATWIRAIQYD